MGVSDRDYTRVDRGRGRGRPGRAGGASRSWKPAISMTWVLIVVNTLIHAVRQFFGPQMLVIDRFRVVNRNGQLTPWVEDWLINIGHFSTGRAMFFFHSQGPGQPLGTAIPLEVWRFVTYQFLHADWFHLFFNMFGLFVFGPIVEEALGRRKFLAFVLACGVFGALAYVLLNLIGQGILLFNGGQPLPFRIPGVLFYDPLLPLVGASAGVFGVIMACAYLAPNDLIDVPVPPLTIRMKPLAYIYFAIAVVQLFIGSKNAGGEAAHVGGALAGYFFVRRVHLLADFFNLVGGPGDQSTKTGKGGRRGAPGAAAVAGQASGPSGAPDLRPATPAEAEVDRILQKVSESGMGSLTEGERRTLEAESARKRSLGQ